jgi:TPR repeat protein
MAWWRKAAEQGNASAQLNLGMLYATGRGAPQDYAQATTWYREAANQGNATAEFYLGALYAEGRGVSQDYAQAAEWYRKAADQGAAVAQFSLGMLYADGHGVPRDYVTAHMWMEVAASRANGDNKTTFTVGRDALATQMTPAEVADAQRRVREWQASFDQRQKSSAR